MERKTRQTERKDSSDDEPEGNKTDADVVDDNKRHLQGKDWVDNESDKKRPADALGGKITMEQDENPPKKKKLTTPVDEELERVLKGLYKRRGRERVSVTATERAQFQRTARMPFNVRNVDMVQTYGMSPQGFTCAANKLCHSEHLPIIEKTEDIMLCVECARLTHMGCHVKESNGGILFV